MVITCETVRLGISDYLDDEVESGLRAALEEHLRNCGPCRAVLDGTRNVISLFGEENMFEPPAGFSRRLHQRLEQNMPRRRGPAFGWMVALAAAALVVLSFQVGKSSAFISPPMRSKLAQPGKGVPPELMVVVSEDGKMFHLPTCTFIHDKAQLRSMTARQAQEEGFAPCVRCMRKYLAETAKVETDAEIHEFADAAVSPQ